MANIIVSTTEHVPGREIDSILGLCKGSTVRAKHIGRDIMAALRNIVGGEMSGYTEMLEEAREEALQRMRANAEHMGADAVVCCRLATSAVMQGAAEILAYGTAVKLGAEKG